MISSRHRDPLSCSGAERQRPMLEHGGVTGGLGMSHPPCGATPRQGGHDAMLLCFWHPQCHNAGC